MDAARAISLVADQIRSSELEFPAEELAAVRFEGGWCVYAPAILGQGDPMAGIPEPSVFLVKDDSGSITEVEDPDAESLGEACLWVSAESADDADWAYDRDPGASAASAFPDLWGPRRAASYDRQAVDILAQALTGERNFPGWLAGRLAELADLLGGGHSLIARHPEAFGAEHVTKLADREPDGPGRVWQTWPAVDPASLPEADTSGWLLTPRPFDDSGPDALEAEEPYVTRLAGAILGQSVRAPLWRACGVIEFAPALMAIRLDDQLSADLEELRRAAAQHPGDEFLREVRAILLTSSPDDPDVEALLRLAIDAEQRGREVIDLDVAAASAYRRVLDRLAIPFDTEAWNMMFE